MELLRRAATHCSQSHGGGYCDEPLVDPREAHLECGGGADRGIEHAFQTGIPEHRHAWRVLARGKDGGLRALSARGRSDDSRVHEQSAGRFDQRRDALRSSRADCVAIDEYGLAESCSEYRRQLRGERLGDPRRNDGKDQPGVSQLFQRDRVHARRGCAFCASRAAVCQRGQDLRAAVGEASTHRRAHVTGRDDRDYDAHPAACPCAI